MNPHPFRSEQPLAWTFHRGTVRRVFSTLGNESPPPLPGREHPSVPWLALPPGPLPETELGQVIGRRVSCRAFTMDPIALPVLATLLRSAYGVLGRSAGRETEWVDRPAPSAGGLYPLEVSMLVRAVEGLSPGVHHFVPATDGLEQLRDDTVPPRLLTYLFMGQPWVAQAAVVVVLSAVLARSLPKYGDRGYRYLLLEAGHVGQNLDLVASALGLGAVNLGGFYDDELARLLCLDPEWEIPLYATAIGVPTADDRMAQRRHPFDN